MRNFILLLMVSFSSYSCIVLNSGNVSSGPLLNITDKYVDIATGEARAYAVFGISVSYSDKLILDAKLNLFKDRPLRSGEYYSNFSCDFSKKIILGIVYFTKVTVSSEVLKEQQTEPSDLATHKKDSVLKSVSKTFNNVIGLYHPQSYFINQVDSFFIGEKIYYNVGSNSEFGSYEITSIDGSNVSIKPSYGSGSNMIIPQTNILFSSKKSIDGFNVGETVDVKVNLGSYKAKIMAISLKKALLLVDDPGYSGYITSTFSKLKKIK